MGLIQKVKSWFTPKNTWAVDYDRWYSAIWPQETNSGAKVDETTALAVPAVWACIRILSEDIGSLPLHLYTRVKGGKERATNHPLYRLLHDRPNPEMSAMSFRETMASHLLTWGNCYAEKETDFTGGRVKALWPLAPNRVEIFRDRETNEIYYIIQVGESGERRLLLRDQVLHIPGLSCNGVYGYSPIGKMREAVGMASALEEFGARFFGQGTNPGLVVSHPGKLGDQAHKNLRESLTTAYSGLGKAHRLMLLEEGMKPEKIGIPPNEAQFIESKRFQLAEIARIYRMPLHKLQEYEKGMAFASVEQFSLDYVVSTLTPWLVRFEQAYNWQLLTSDLERRRYFAEHLVAGLLRGDIKTRYEAYAQARNWGWLCADDIREMENLNPLPDGKGKIYLQPLNMVEAGTPPPPPAPTPEPSEVEPDQETRNYWKAYAFRDVLEDVIKQILSREANGLKRLSENANGEWDQIVEDYYDLKLQETIERKIEPVIRALVYQHSNSPSQDLVTAETWEFVQNHIKQSKEYLWDSKDRDKTLQEFSGRATALATQAMVEITERLQG